jgi:dihydroxyacetone kinase-like protein
MKMKKFINKPENIVTELLQGFALSSPDKIRLAGSNLVARAVPKAKGKVGVGDAGRQRP